MSQDTDAFPTLDDEDLAVLAAQGQRRRVEAGEVLYRQGDATYDFFVILSGSVDILVDTDGEERLITSHGPGRFLGELNMLSGLRVFVTARVAEPGEVLVLSRDELRRVITTNTRIGDIVLAAFLARRSILLSGAAGTLRVVGSRFSPESLAVREFLARSRIPHEWLEPERDEGVEDLLRAFEVAPGELPVVIATGTVLRRPTPGRLAEYLGLTIDRLPERCFDLVVVGGGPAGLAASVYGASEGLRTLGVEQLAVGGQAGTSSRIENYLGFPTGISGGDLTERAVVQAEKFGAHLSSPCRAESLREEAGHLVVRLSDGTDVAGRAVIAASGARYRRVDAAGLERFEGNGVFYAATELEARLCAGAPVAVVGGGNSAGQAALFLAQSGSPVTIVIRGPDLARSMSRYLVDRIEADPRVEVLLNAQVTRFEGDTALTGICVRRAGQETPLACAALFSFIGAEPSSAWLSGRAALDERGFVLTDRALDAEQLDERWAALDRSPLPFETSHPGLFAAGDLRSGSSKRVAAAVGEGSSAVRSVHEYLAFAH